MRSWSIILTSQETTDAGQNSFLKHANFGVNISFFQLSLLEYRVASSVSRGRRCAIEYRQCSAFSFVFITESRQVLTWTNCRVGLLRDSLFARLRFVRVHRVQMYYTRDSKCNWSEGETILLVKAWELATGILLLSKDFCSSFMASGIVQKKSCQCIESCL